MIKTLILEEGCFYHIYNRGTNRKPIFMDDSDYGYFLHLLIKYILPVADIYCYCLMNNHFHLLVRIKEKEEMVKPPKVIFQAFSNFFNAYAKTFNNRYKRTGKLFEERFKRKKVKDDNYFSEIIYYIHANPQRHQCIDDFRNYPYSSFNIIMSSEKTVLNRDEILEWFGGRTLFEKYHMERISYLLDEE